MTAEHLGAPRFVLVVEDDETLAALIPQVLMRVWGSDGTVYGMASSLRQARCIIQDHGNIPDLLVLDLYLPDSKGLETLDAVVDMLPPTTGVLAISAYLSDMEGKEALARGATQFISKQGKFRPVDIVDACGRAWAATKGLRLRLGAAGQRGEPPQGEAPGEPAGNGPL